MSTAGSEAARAPRMAMLPTLKTGPVSTVREIVTWSVSGWLSMASSAAGTLIGWLSTVVLARAS